MKSSRRRSSRVTNWPNLGVSGFIGIKENENFLMSNSKCSSFLNLFQPCECGVIIHTLHRGRMRSREIKDPTQHTARG